ncbi:molybdenum cofactor biosynthesis protein MoaE [Citricoccus sp. K5]|uniref:molybdenum cofactor biosynthesis protein MoaE n=1 Tax=Citricoccus sp. K5 TaxID=2653135 RepID=UPI0012F09269|nr:molybdenum cofactor biosynthesis protein MoaE [Citricoccus sp. K5]VXB26442.1 Molybdopterin synthase catalytic subunit 1 [Citricoccus sp. K5]
MPATEDAATVRPVSTTLSPALRSVAPVRTGVTEEPLDPVALESSVVTPACGAALTFTGIVRNHDPEATGTVTSLDYSAHPDAGAVLAEIVTRHVRGPGDPRGEVRVAAAHRIGHLDVGDLALVVSVASAHRAEAFEVCRAVVEDIKAEVPIWKKQQTATGEAHWVGLP